MTAAATTGFGGTTNWGFEALWLALAVAVHAAFLGGMPKPPNDRTAITPPSTVDVSFIEETIVEPEPVLEAEAEPEVEPEPEPVAPPPKPKTFKAPKRPAAPPKEPPAAAKETPIAFDNVVLTNESESDSSWKTEQASGKSVDGPIGSPDAAVTGRSRSGIVGGVIDGVGVGVVVDVGDLSKAPIPPPLKAKLERLYPKKARSEGVEGGAVIRLQVNPDGMPTNIRVVSESPPGYELGQACVKTLRGERWKPPVDKNGKRVTTRVTYRCGFEIRY